MKKLSLWIAVMGLLSACEKVIHADLAESAPQLVIEGTISDQPGSLVVRVSRSSGFYDVSGFSGVTGAVATISDDAGNTAILSMTSPGVYTSATISGVPGRTYTLSVSIDGKEYSGVCRMPQPVDCQDVMAMTQEANGNVRRFVIPVYNDPADAANYYRFKLHVDDKPVNKILVRSDQLTNGTQVTQPLGPFFDEMVPGDSVLVDMQTIDAPVYTYFQGLGQALATQNAAPANPQSNLSGGCLGYFSAYTSSMRWVEIVE